MAMSVMLSGCTSGPMEGRGPTGGVTRGLSFGPFFRTEIQTQDGREIRNTEAFWPLGMSWSDEDKSVFGVRPLFRYTRGGEEEDSDELLILWPFGRSSRRSDDVVHQYLPFYYSRDFRGIDGTWDRDRFIFPFLFWGDDPRQGSYTAFFPFFGTLKGLFAKDRMRFGLFPFYFDTRVGKYETKNIFWPFYSVGDGPTRKVRTYWPFYGMSQREGLYDRRWYLWPFIHTQTNAIQSETPEKVFFLFPFYGRRVSTGASTHSVLYPLVNVTVDHRRGYRHVDAPYPFFRYVKGPDVQETRIWPFWGRRVEEGFRRDQLLFPFLWRWRYETGRYHRQKHLFVPFVALEKSQYLDNGETDATTRIWPLFHRKRERDGSVRIRAIEPLFFEDYRPEGLDWSYGDLVRIFQYESRPTGEVRWNVLGPTIEHRREADSASDRILGFRYDRSRTPGEESWNARRFSFLEGLFEFSHGPKGKAVRLFYLPSIPLGGEK